MGDPITCGLIVAGSGVVGGFIVHRVIPSLYDFLKSICGDFFYKTVIVTLTQNPLKTINLIKYLHKVTGSTNNVRTTHIMLKEGETQQEFHVPINKIRVAVKGFEFDLKVNVDGAGNIVNVIMSAWKRIQGYQFDKKKVHAFDEFIGQFSGVTIGPQT